MKEGGLCNWCTDTIRYCFNFRKNTNKDVLSVSDNYFKNLEYRSEIYALAYRETIELVQSGAVSKS